MTSRFWFNRFTDWDFLFDISMTPRDLYNRNPAHFGLQTSSPVYFSTLINTSRIKVTYITYIIKRKHSIMLQNYTQF